MIIGHKQKVYSRPPPALEFDKFLKIRSQKQSIIQSQSQPIAEKIQGFEQLLKLTKTGSSICAQTFNKRHPNSHLKNKSQSSKTINVIGGTFNSNANNENQYNRFVEDFESDEAQLKKLNKMVYGISEWEDDKEKDSFHPPHQNHYPKTSYEKKRYCNTTSNRLRNQKSSQQMRQRKKQAYTSCDGKKFRKFYEPLRKHQAASELNRINSEFVKTSAKLNYPAALLNCNFLEQNSNHFRDLKNKIKVLEAKAIKQYGLKFEPPNLTKQKKPRIWDDSKGDSEEKENEQISFSDLELAPILAKEFPNRYQSYNQTFVAKQCPINDASIPKNLIQIVQHKGQTFHTFGLNSPNIANPQLSFKKNKMKKGYLCRPKSFKPTFTYIQI